MIQVNTKSPDHVILCLSGLPSSRARYVVPGVLSVRAQHSGARTLGVGVEPVLSVSPAVIPRHSARPDIPLSAPRDRHSHHEIQVGCPQAFNVMTPACFHKQLQMWPRWRGHDSRYILSKEIICQTEGIMNNKVNPT